MAEQEPEPHAGIGSSCPHPKSHGDDVEQPTWMMCPGESVQQQRKPESRKPPILYKGAARNLSNLYS